MKWFSSKRSIGIAGSAAVAALALAVPAAGALAAGRPQRVAAALPVITVTMNGKSISVGGSLVSGGVKVVSKVSGEASGNPTLSVFRCRRPLVSAGLPVPAAPLAAPERSPAHRPS